MRHLEKVLGGLAEAGFSGRLGLSVDKFHGIQTAALARELDAVVEWSDMLGRYLLVSADLTMTLNWNHLAPVERAEQLTGAWDGSWFQEEYCEGPGQALIVNPKGEVKP